MKRGVKVEFYLGSYLRGRHAFGLRSSRVGMSVHQQNFERLAYGVGQMISDFTYLLRLISV
jgi:hypothetical protein